jgi:hypothetical protein
MPADFSTTTGPEWSPLLSRSRPACQAGFISRDGRSSAGAVMSGTVLPGGGRMRDPVACAQQDTG